jgi:hypothetical protein
MFIHFNHSRSTDRTAHIPLEALECVYTVLNVVCNVSFESSAVGNMLVCNILQIRVCPLSQPSRFMMNIKYQNCSLQIFVLADILFPSSNAQ